MYNSTSKGAPSTEDIVAWYSQLSGLYSSRNAEYYSLRRAFSGSSLTGAQATLAGLGEFNDRKKISYNLVNFSIRRYMDELSSPHRIMGVPNGVEPYDVDLAERRQKALDRLKEEEKIDLKVVQAAYHQGLLDKAVWHVRPDANAPMKVRVQLVTPENYMPIPVSSDWSDKRGVICSWTPFDIQNIPGGADPQGDVQRSVMDPNRVIEYWDRHYYVRLEGGKKQGWTRSEYEHGCGEILFEEAHNIPIPDQQRGQGDADHIIGLNETLNESLSDQADVLAYLANPIVVVRGSRSGTKGLTWGPRAIWDLERDGSAEILTWAGAPPTSEAHILRLMQGIEDGTGLSSPAFGREIPSGVSGEAVRSILSGYNTRVGTKQQMMALSLAALYKKVQKVWEKQYPNWEIPILGERGKQLNPQGSSGPAGTSVKPKEFEGHYGIQVVFEPQNETVKVFTEIQKLQAGIQSRLTTMKRLGISAPEDEYKRVLMEKMLDAQLAMMSQGVMPQGGMGLPPGMGGGRPEPQEAQPLNISNQEELAAQLGASNPGTLAEELTGVKGIRPGGRGDVKIQDIMDRLEEADLEDQVRAEGTIASEGATPDKIHLRVRNAVDAGRVRQALGPLASRAVISVGDENPVQGDSIAVGRPRGGRSRYGR